MLIAEFFLWEWAKDSIGSFFTGILLFLDSIVYQMISWVYQIIMVLCGGNILNDTNVINDLIKRLYVIIGVIMLFIIAYSLLRALVNPDEALKGKKSPTKIISNIIISIALIAFIPTIFDFAIGFQQAILQKDTIGKIILGTTSTTEASNNNSVINNGGSIMAKTVLGGFLHPNVEKEGGCTLKEDATYECTNLEIEGEDFNTWWNNMANSGNFLNITVLNDAIGNGDITYYYIISTIAGVFVLFVLVGYCFDIALRLVKLSVFELIAPLPVLCRVVPNEQASKVFSNWLKATISTYIEVFIRLAILYFGVFIMKIVADNFFNIFYPFTESGASPVIALIAQVLVVLGIVMFIRQAPSIIKDITGLDGNKYNPFTSAMKGIASIGALGTGAVRGFTNTEFNRNGILNTAKSVGNKFKNTLLGGAKSVAGASGKEYKKFGDIRSNINSSVNDVINKQRKSASSKLMKQQELEEWRKNHPNNNNIPAPVYKTWSKVQKGGHDVLDSVKTWAGEGGFESLKQKRDQISEVQKAFAQTVSMAKSEVEKNLKDYYAEDGRKLDELQIDIDYFKAQLSNIKADDSLTSVYSELQKQLFEEKDTTKQAEIRQKMAILENDINQSKEEKRHTISAKLKEAQDALDDGIKFATKTVIDYTKAGTQGKTVKVAGQDWEVQTVAGLSAQIEKADNLLKQNSSIMPTDLPQDGEVTITVDGVTKTMRTRDYKKFRNTLGNEVDKYDSEISQYTNKTKKDEK